MDDEVIGVITIVVEPKSARSFHPGLTLEEALTVLEGLVEDYRHEISHQKEAES